RTTTSSTSQISPSHQCILVALSPRFFGNVFDPLGLLSPFFTQIKLYLRKIYENVYGWYKELEPHFKDEARKLIHGLRCLNEITQPRLVKEEKKFEIWFFSDASAKAYGSCVYIHNLETQKSRLLLARGKLASLDRSIPQLELNALLMSAEIWSEIKPLIKVAKQVRKFSDSLVTLARVASSPNKSHDAYVNHRLRIIREKTEGVEMRYINAKENPADLVSRGLNIRSLIKSDLWFNGPKIDVSTDCTGESRVFVTSGRQPLSKEKK